MESLTLTGSKWDLNIQYLQIVARLSNTTLNFNHVHWNDPAFAEACKKSPTGTVPSLNTADGVLAETGAIAHYLANASTTLFGGNNWERAQVSQWSQFAEQEVRACNSNVIYPVLGKIKNKLRSY
jgi:glutathione S-transferase